MCCSLFHLPNFFFHFLTGLERHHELLWHEHLIASSRVAGFPSRPLLDFEHTEISQFDATVFHQCLHDGIERLLHNLFCLELCQPNGFGNIFNDFFLGHGWSPPI